jgi:uncharacterized protein (TIGR03067 family)
MLRRTLTASLAMLLVAPALLRADDAPKGDKDLDGTWEVVSTVRDGKEMEPQTKGIVLTIKGESVTVKVGEVSHEATIKIKADPSKTPRTLDLMPKEGPQKGMTMKAIYEVKGDELKFCHGDPEAERPTELASKEGSGLTLAILKRVKK